MKDRTIALALSFLVSATFCVPAQADGFKFPEIKIPNPFKKASSTEIVRPPRATGSNIADDDPPGVRETNSFSIPKPKLPKFEMPSFGREMSETRQSRSNLNRPTEPSALDKFSRGTKNFFGKVKTTLMPWTDEPAPSASRRLGPPSGSGSQHAARANSRSRSSSRSNDQVREASRDNGFSFPWPKPKESVEKEIRSPTDFLALPRPKY